ncbi:MAG: DNA repair and recombination protein RadA [Candidatus Odinarchaeota archaeon]
MKAVSDEDYKRKLEEISKLPEKDQFQALAELERELKGHSVNSKQRLDPASISEKTPIRDLPFVNDETATKLADHCFINLLSLVTASSSEVARALSISDDAAMKLITKVRTKLDIKSSTAKEELVRRKTIPRITTGSSDLDELFGGNGIESGSLTELFGEFRTGKTQLAHQLCVNVQLPRSMGGLREERDKPVIAVYVDTEETFRPERLVQMYERFFVSGNDLLDIDVLGNVKLEKATNSEQLLDLIKFKLIKEVQLKDIQLIIIDSLTSHVLNEHPGNDFVNHDTRSKKLRELINELLKLTNRFKITVVFTNQVYHKVSMFFGDPTQPHGSHEVGHTAQTRVYLRKSKGNNRIARIIDSPLLPEGEAIFTINKVGILNGDMSDDTKEIYGPEIIFALIAHSLELDQTGKVKNYIPLLFFYQEEILKILHLIVDDIQKNKEPFETWITSLDDGSRIAKYLIDFYSKQQYDEETSDSTKSVIRTFVFFMVYFDQKGMLEEIKAPECVKEEENCFLEVLGELKKKLHLSEEVIAPICEKIREWTSDKEDDLHEKIEE